MNGLQSFEQFLASQGTHVPTLEFLINLILTSLVSALIAYVYVRWGTAISNRRLIASQFILLACTTMLVITIVKSSLALSLGLVGALSIVRFRTAIKEPEELIFLFLNIGVGLGFGANQRVITLVGFLFLMGILCLKNSRGKKTKNKQLLLTISHAGKSQKLTVTDTINILGKHVSHIDLKRFDESKDSLEMSFFIDCDDFEKLNASKLELQKIVPNLKVSFSDIGSLL